MIVANDIVKIVEGLRSKVEKSKLELAEANATKQTLMSRAKELENELLKGTNSKTLKEAYTKLYNSHEIESKLEVVLGEVLAAYNKGDMTIVLEKNKVATELSQKLNNLWESKEEVENADVVTEEKVYSNEHICSECGEKMYETLSGYVCDNGHGGAEKLITEKDIDFIDDEDDILQEENTVGNSDDNEELIDD